ncbi:MAG: DIP1984 family protein [Synergistaceae bacterium]|nr:DIP1984 family protein [Synergistaceae bacterium]
MKLAEALSERAALQRQNRSIVRHIEENVRLPEDEEPTVSVENLIREYETNMLRLSELIRRINKTNCLTEMAGRTITDAIARRDCLSSHIKAYTEIYNEVTSHSRNQFDKGEPRVKYVRYLDSHKLKDKIDGLSKEFRLLDTELQGKNWTTELI